MVRQGGLDFSFSGLKTFALNTLNSLAKVTEQDKADIALAFEVAVVETLKIKCKRALEQTGFSRLVVAGGVGANLRLRKGLTDMLSERGEQVYFPEQQYCTDNGAMIAYAGGQRLMAGQTDEGILDVMPRWSLEDLPAL